MSKYESNPNQRNIFINRDMPQKDSGELYLTVYTRKLGAAAQVLSEVPFKLYIYLLCNKDKYDLWFSPAAFAKEYGVGVSTARRAFNTLMEEGFIVETGKNQYSFYEEPQKKSSFVSKMKVEYRMLETDTGFKKLDYNTFYNEAKAEGMNDKDINITWEASAIAED